MNLEKYGYKEETIKVREMSMAELRIEIIQGLLKRNYRYVNIRLVNPVGIISVKMVASWNIRLM